jgi:hypothetical protein
MTKNLTEAQLTIVHELTEVRSRLDLAAEEQAKALRVMQEEILRGLRDRLAAASDIAAAVGVPRNYVDQIRSRSDLPKVVRTERHVYSEPERSDYLDDLREASDAYQDALDVTDDAREARNRLVSGVYYGKVLGPGRIAAAVGVDRNHVHRIANAHKALLNGSVA